MCAHYQKWHGGLPFPWRHALADGIASITLRWTILYTGKRYSTLNQGFKPDRQKGNRKKSYCFLKSWEETPLKKTDISVPKCCSFNFSDEDTVTSQQPSQFPTLNGHTSIQLCCVVLCWTFHTTSGQERATRVYKKFIHRGKHWKNENFEKQ